MSDERHATSKSPTVDLMAELKARIDGGATNQTVKDLRRYAVGVTDSDDRELIQHAADLIEVLLKPALPSAVAAISRDEFFKAVTTLRSTAGMHGHSRSAEETRSHQRNADKAEQVLMEMYHALAQRSSTGETSDVSEVLAEVERAVTKFPTWPTDPLHALAVLGEEFGELTKEALQLVYEPHKTSPGEVRKEALQTAAMALRFYRSLERYEFTRGHQHVQRVEAAQEVHFSPSSATGRTGGERG